MIENGTVEFGIPKPRLDKYVFMNKVGELLNIGFQTNTNIILFGPGGHGKSEYSVDFFKDKNVTPFVLTMGSGMNTDRLFGGMNIGLFNSSGGKIEYLVENSFMNHEYVIFEELFDAPDYILEQLKDILSSGYFRNGSQQFKIKTKFIVCNTNRTRQEFSKNASLAALLERFPLEMEVKWDTYNKYTYSKLLNSVNNDKSDELLVDILTKFAKNKVIISPRIAIVASRLVAECGHDCLEFLADFKTKDGMLKRAIGDYNAIKRFRSESKSVMDDILKIPDGKDMDNITNIYELISIRDNIRELSDVLDNMSVTIYPDEIISEKSDFIKSANQSLDSRSNRVNSILKIRN